MDFLSVFSSNAGACAKKRSHIHAAAVLISMLPLFLAKPALAQTDTSRWMGELVDDPQYAVDSPMDQELYRFIFPGTHNSAAYGVVLPDLDDHNIEEHGIPDFNILDPFDAPPLACDKCIDPDTRSILETPGLDVLMGYFMTPFAISQHRTVGEQLADGARAFDMRFFRANAGDASVSDELTVGKFYGHRWFAGAESGNVFTQIQTFLDAPDHENEIIILNFSHMYEGNGDMGAPSLNAIFGDLINKVGTSRIAPRLTRNDSSTLKELQTAGEQVIVIYSGAVPIGALDSAIQPYIWPAIKTAAFWDPAVTELPDNGYPKADTWGTEPALFRWMETLSQHRGGDTNQMFQMFVNMGPDNGKEFPDMLSRSLMCNPLKTYDTLKGVYDPLKLLFDLVGIGNKPGEMSDADWNEVLDKIRDFFEGALKSALTSAAVEAGLDLIGVCPAINDDWDRFESLKDVADFTNPKLLPSLVGLRRDQVNIVLTDFYPANFSNEVKNLNQGVTRVSLRVSRVEERECHDCFPLTALRLSDPDYYPEFTFFPNNTSDVRVPDVWPTYPSPEEVAADNSLLIFTSTTIPPGITEAGETQHNSHWGGPWLETSGTTLTPVWRAFRALRPDTPTLDFEIRIWDQDNNICLGAPPVEIWCGWDDLSNTNGSARVISDTIPSWESATSPVRDPAQPDLLARPVDKVVGGLFTNCDFFDLLELTCDINLDSSVVHYSYYSCLWAPLPGMPFDQSLSCDLPSGNTPPVPVVTVSIAATKEGFLAQVSGVDSYDPDDHNGSPGYNSDFEWIGRVVDWEWDCDHDPVPVCLNDSVADDYVPTNAGQCNAGYTATNFVPGRGCINSLVILESGPFGNVDSGLYFVAGDGFNEFVPPRTQLVALRVTDMGGAKSVMDPTPIPGMPPEVPDPVPVGSFEVTNRDPQIAGFEVTQQPGTDIVTMTIDFWDSTRDDSPFFCDVSVDGSVGVYTSTGEEVFIQQFTEDPPGPGLPSPQTLYKFRCVVSGQMTPGTHRLFPSVADKDGASSDTISTFWERFITVFPPAVTSAAGDGAGSLRDAIANAADGDVIGFAQSLSGQTITLNGSPLIIDKSLTIDASGLPGGLTISGNNTSRVFEKSGAASTAVLKSLTITEGSTPFGGGCIYQGSGELTLIDSTVHNCFTQGQGGGIYSAANNNGLFLENSTITGNLALKAGGIYIGLPASGSRFSMVHSTISGNTAVSSQAGVGGLVHDVPTCVVGTDNVCLTIENSIIAGNFHPDTTSSPDISINSQVASVTITGENLIGINAGVATYFPAGILAGTLADPIDPLLHPLKDNGGPTMTLLPRNGSMALNFAEYFVDGPTTDQRGFARLIGGYNDLGAVERQDIDVDDTDDDGVGDPDDNCPLIANPGQSNADGDYDGDACDPITTVSVLGDEITGSLREVIAAVPPGTVIDFDLAASGATIVLTGGQLVVDKELTIDASNLPLGLTLSGDNASRVIEVTAAGNLALNGLTISDGQATGGGCVLNNGMLGIVDSTVTGCSSPASGGGISNNGSMTVTNTTVSGNSQVNFGAIFNAGNATLIHSTIADNHASGDPDAASGGIINLGGVLNIENSIVAGNTGGVNPDIYLFSGTINASGANLVGDNSSVTTEFPAGPLAGTAGAPLIPLLNLFGDHGGPTPTMLPRASSAAIDSAIATGNTPAVDQRGFARPGGALYDLGAVERQANDTDGFVRGDHDASGRADILWRQPNTGQNWMYRMNGHVVVGSNSVLTVPLPWQVAGTGDYSGDGKADVLWRNPSNGQNWMYRMNGHVVVGSNSVLTVPLPWVVAGTGDFDADGKSDILWRNPNTGQNWMYRMNGHVVVGSNSVLTVPLPWEVAGTGDYDGDGKSDILWRNPNTGQNWMYRMNGHVVVGSNSVLTVPLPWEVAGTGDFDANGKSDILWRNPSNGQNWMYRMNGHVVVGSNSVLTVPMPWQVDGTGDYDGDGKSDILWRNPTNGQNWMYRMNGHVAVGSNSVLTVPMPWEVETGN